MVILILRTGQIYLDAVEHEAFAVRADTKDIIETCTGSKDEYLVHILRSLFSGKSDPVICTVERQAVNIELFQLLNECFIKQDLDYYASVKWLVDDVLLFSPFDDRKRKSSHCNDFVDVLLFERGDERFIPEFPERHVGFVVLRFGEQDRRCCDT